MPTRKDWATLARETVLAVDGEDVADLYTVEWAEAREALLSRHRDVIAAERSHLKRALLTGSAIVYGLVERLTPARRLVFFGVLVATSYSLVRLATLDSSAEGMAGAVLTLLLAGGALTVLLLLELVDKLRFRDELVMARELQADLVPHVLPGVPGFELGAFNRVANTVGGDLYEFAPMPDGRLALLFGDASGHGMAAGLVMAVAHTAWRIQVEADPSPTAVTSALNRVLCRTGSCRTAGSRSFFSCAALLIERDGTFTAVVAGHPPLLRVDTSGTIVERFGKGSYPLGIKPSLAYAVESGRLGEGESLVLHSDGLPEARDAEGREFGDDRIAAALRRNAGYRAEEVVSALSGYLHDFLRRKPAEDDVSIAVIRRVTAN